MAGLTTIPNRKSAPLWVKDFGGREHVVPFPAKLKVSEFSDMGGTRITSTAAVNSVAVNEVQTITVTATGGTFTLTSTIPGGAGTTAPIAYNASAATVQTALDAILGIGNSFVSGGPSATNPIVVTFAGRLAAQNLAVLTANATALTGPSAGVAIVQTSDGAAGATQLTITALGGRVFNGEVLYFNNGASAVITEEPKFGATVVKIKGLTKPLPANAYAIVSRPGQKTILSGTLCGRTYAERDNKEGFGPWAEGDDEVYLLYFTLDNALNENDAEFYRNNSLVAENYLPDWLFWTDAQKAAMREHYTPITGFGG